MWRGEDPGSVVGRVTLKLGLLERIIQGFEIGFLQAHFRRLDLSLSQERRFVLCAYSNLSLNPNFSDNRALLNYPRH